MTGKIHNVLGICAGVGGLELGISLALGLRGEGCRGIAYVEREAAAITSLVASMEEGWFHPCPIWSDLTTFRAERFRGLVDILASGDPCQGNSVAGKRLGADDERFLAPEVVRITEECRPDLVFRENVPGNAHGQLEALVPGLEKLGYRVAAGILSSAETGNTMRRERLFIMARAPCARQRSGASEQSCYGSGRLVLARPEPRRYAVECSLDMARAFGHFEAGRQSTSGQAGSGRPFGELGRPGGTLESAGNPERRQGDSARRADREQLLLERQEGTIRLGAPERELVRAAHGGRDDQQSSQPRSNSGQRRGQESLRGPSIAMGRPAVIPGPRDPRWCELLDTNPELRPALGEAEAQSLIRRGVDAMAHRVERLRACGNGVDPVAAATAFLSLSALLDESGD